MKWDSLSLSRSLLHAHTHSTSSSHTLNSSSSVFHLLFLALFSLAYLWLAWLSKQEMGMQNTADRIKRTSLVCVCVCGVADKFIPNRRCVLH